MNNRIFTIIQEHNSNRGLLWTEEDKDEFAQLIVQECIDTLLDCSVEYCVLPHVAEEIREHFGIGINNGMVGKGVYYE